jgi:hypothetical protein
VSGVGFRVSSLGRSGRVWGLGSRVWRTLNLAFCGREPTITDSATSVMSKGIACDGSAASFGTDAVAVGGERGFVFGVWGLGLAFRVSGLGFQVSGLGFGVWR